MPQTVSFLYRNHKGIIAERTVDVEDISFLTKPGYEYQPGWFINGHCHDRKARRSFALSHIVLRDMLPAGMILMRLGSSMPWEEREALQRAIPERMCDCERRYDGETIIAARKCDCGGME